MNRVPSPHLISDPITDLDADALLAPALAVALRRVVVKRPKGAPPLAGRTPSHVIASPNTRYDVYVTLAGA